MTFEWEKTDPIAGQETAQPWEANDPIVSEVAAPWEADDPIDHSKSLFKRFGKQFYNVALAAPAQAIGTKSPIGKMKTDIKALRSLDEDVKGRFEKGQPLTLQEIEEYSKPYSKWSIGGLLGIDKPEWQQRLAIDYQAGNVNIKEPETQETKTKKLQTVLSAAKIETAEKADISFAVSEAENWKEKGVDIVAGISGFIAQLAALKKAFPQAPTVFIWELQNQATGGTPGKGALTYGAFAAPGKLIKGVSTAAKAGRLVSESALLGGMSAVSQKIETGEIDAVEVLISAGIPVGLRAAGSAKGVLRKALKAKNPKVLKAINQVAKPKTIDGHKVKIQILPTDRTKILSVKKGFVRLYRGENINNPKHGRQKISQKLLKEHLGKQYKGQTVDEGYGGWWTTDAQYAAEFASGHGKAGQIQFIDLPLRTAAKYSTGLFQPGPGKPLVPTEEYFLPQLRTTPKIKAPVRPVEARTLEEGIQTTNKRVIAWSEKAKVINATERKAAVGKLRKQQHARFTEVYKAERAAGTGVFEAARVAKRARAGKAGTPEIDPLILSPKDKAFYGQRIEAVYPESKGFQRGGAVDAITKMERGRIPTNYEFGLLEPVFGKETTTKLFETLKGKKGLELWDIPTLVRDVPKALRFGFDPQAARGLSKLTLRHPLIYLNSLGKNIRGIFSKKFIDKANAVVEASPAYKLGKKEYKTNYLSTKPWASVRAGDRLEQFGNISEVFLRSKNRVIRGVGVWLRASERGANLGMNSALNKLVIKGEKDLARYSRNRSLSEADISAWRRRRGHDINIYTKRITARHPKGKAVQRAANWLVFSPAYTASGLASGPQSFIKLATGKGFADKTYAMQIMLSRLAGLVAVSQGVGYVAHKWRLKNPTEEPPIDSSANPIDPLFGKIREGNEVYDLGFGDVADYRLMARIGLSAHMEMKRFLTGKETTTFRGKKVPTAGESLGRYLNSKRTLYLSLAKQLATGKDWLGNSVTLKDTALDNLPFEFFQAFVEAGEADGLWEDMANGLELDTAKKALHNLAPSIAALGGVGTGSYPTPTYVTRSKFRNIIAQKEHNKRWDDLTQIEQRKLSVKHRKPFDVFERKIKEESVERPYNLQRTQDEQIKSGRKITKLLSKPNRLKVKGISVAVSRRPKNFYLNDERYQQYQELTAKYLNERLSQLRLGGKSDKVRTKMLEVTIKIAKSKAFRDVRRQMR